MKKILTISSILLAFILTSCVAVHLNLWDPSSEDWKVKGIYVNHSALFNYIVGL